VTATVVDLPPAPNVAVTVAFWLLVIAEAAVTWKFAAECPAATVTVAGTVNKEVSLETVTTKPLPVAVWVRLTEQLAVAPALRLVGLQARLETRPAGALTTMLMLAVLETPPSDAVTVAL